MFLFFVLPAFVAIAVLSIWFAKRVDKVELSKQSYYNRRLWEITGFFCAITLTTAVVWAVPEGTSNSDWGPFILRAAMTLLGPIAIGLVLVTLRQLFDSQYQVLSFVAAGAFRASLLCPFAVLFLSWTKAVLLNSI